MHKPVVIGFVLWRTGKYIYNSALNHSGDGNGCIIAGPFFIKLITGLAQKDCQPGS